MLNFYKICGFLRYLRKPLEFEMKRNILILTFLIFSACLAFSQVSADINDSFYKEAQNWELRGLTTPLPLLRPYPLSVVERVLNDVIQNGSEKDSELAQSEYERIFAKPYGFFAEGSGNFKISSADEDENKDSKGLSGEVGVGGDIRLHPLASFSYKVGIYGETKSFSEYSPLYKNILTDTIFDHVEAGPFDAYTDWNMNFSVGKENLYGTAGLNRVGFGPFYGEGLALNDTGYHSANFVFSASSKNFSYAQVFEVIGATRNIIENGLDLNDGKYLAFHALRWNKFKKFNVTYYENIIFGPSTNISYFIPAPYYAMQNIGGANDNLQMGLLFEVKPFSGFNWATDFFADDMELDDLLKLNFDTKLRFGFQTGVIYSPENSVLDKISFNYTAVMPYVYAHWEYDNDDSGSFTGKTWNYQNYTNAGIHIGSTLDPNSDKISFSVRIKPVKKLTLDLAASFTRHSNSAEDFSDEEAAEYMLAEKGTYATDGTVSMSQMFSSNTDSGKHVDSAWEKLGFMTSSHKMYVVQAGLNGEYELARTKYGKMSLTFGYTFEYIKNAGVNRNIYKGGTLDYSFKEDSDGNRTYYKGEQKNDNKLSEEDAVSAAKIAASKALDEWVGNLYDCTNHYISVGFKYAY